MGDAAWLREAVVAYRSALEERACDIVPLDWATSSGNEGLCLIILAAQTGNLSMARVAVGKIEKAEATMRAYSHLPAADSYSVKLQAARALAAQLNED